MVNYNPIAALVDQISMDTWDVLQQIKERRPAMMLSELIDCRTRAPQRPEPSELQPSAHEPVKAVVGRSGRIFQVPEHLFEKEAGLDVAGKHCRIRAERTSGPKPHAFVETGQCRSPT